MPVQPCPACNRPTPRLLDFTSQLASVNYYQCDWCTHIWTASKEDGSLVTHVTNPPQKYTALRCPSCSQAVAKIEHVELDTIEVFCPGCGYRRRSDKPGRPQ